MHRLIRETACALCIVTAAPAYAAEPSIDAAAEEPRTPAPSDDAQSVGGPPRKPIWRPKYAFVHPGMFYTGIGLGAAGLTGTVLACVLFVVPDHSEESLFLRPLVSLTFLLTSAPLLITGIVLVSVGAKRVQVETTGLMPTFQPLAGGGTFGVVGVF